MTTREALAYWATDAPVPLAYRALAAAALRAIDEEVAAALRAALAASQETP